MVGAALGITAWAQEAESPAHKMPAGLNWPDAPLAKIEGEWTHVSPTSVVISWKTDGPAISWIEYGKGDLARHTAGGEPGLDSHALSGIHRQIQVLSIDQFSL